MSKCCLSSPTPPFYYTFFVVWFGFSHIVTLAAIVAGALTRTKIVICISYNHRLPVYDYSIKHLYPIIETDRTISVQLFSTSILMILWLHRPYQLMNICCHPNDSHLRGNKYIPSFITWLNTATSAKTWHVYCSNMVDVSLMSYSSAYYPAGLFIVLFLFFMLLLLLIILSLPVGKESSSNNS